MEKIFIQLLGEGTIVYRPVFAIKLKENTYEISKDQIYDSEDQTWEFIPGTKVIVENKKLEEELVLVAVKKIE